MTRYQAATRPTFARMFASEASAYDLSLLYVTPFLYPDALQ
jgi:hypothetical protein